jgi:hypothetical protein
MADGNNSADYAFTLPNYFPAPGQVLQSAIAQRERQLANEAEAAERKRQYDLRQQEKDETEAFRKMQYLQEYTDPSKYQTGVDAADAIIKDSLNNIYNEFRTLKLDPVTLADALRGKVGDLVSASTAMKNEAKAFEQYIPDVKNKFKSVNIDLLRQNFKGDLVNRYIKGTGFNKTPEQSKILENLANPEFLADYTGDISSIVDAVKDAKNRQKVTAFVGKDDQNVKKYGANIGIWEKPNFDVNAGYLPPGTIPTTSIISEERPISGVNAPVPVVNDDVYVAFAQSPSNQAEIIGATKKRFNGSSLPAYNTLSDEEKMSAQKNTLYDIIKKVDQPGFTLEGIQTPNVTKVNVGGAPSKTANYDYIKNVEKSIRDNDSDAFISLADNLAGLDGGKFNYVSAKPYKRPDGTITGVEFVLNDEYGEPVTRVLKSDSPNLRAQITKLYQEVAGPSAVAEKGITGEPVKKTVYKLGNKTFTRLQLNKEGYTDAQIEQAIKLGNLIKQ